MRKSYKGFTLVEIMIVVAIIGLLVAIALPNFVIARKKSQMNSCKANLKQIDGAIQQYLLDTANATPVSSVADAESVLMPNYIKGSDLPACPAYGDYTIVTNEVSCATGGADTDYPHVLAQ
jgi:prepilin-type N-terminal cleavage/methylation domain-containing protein